MKKNLLIFCAISLFSCDNDDSFQNCDIINNVTVNLVNPQFSNLLTPGGWAYSAGGPYGIILYNAGTSYKAFSRECPINNNCTQQMIVENDIKMVCPCDDSEFSILDGTPQTEGVTVAVCEFRVTQVNNNILDVSNF
ncbi:Rieske (2Fe-2S) protein [Urechidicola sp. KH5]